MTAHWGASFAGPNLLKKTFTEGQFRSNRDHCVLRIRTEFGSYSSAEAASRPKL